MTQQDEPPLSGRGRHETIVCGALALALSFLWIWPQAVHLRQVPDRGDPVFSAWRLAWVAHRSSDPHLMTEYVLSASMDARMLDATLLPGSQQRLYSGPG